ncbi:unnamed protein product [Pleuronectes platessa]|uniref:Uncharacterized protein n=1 Tax=Pleuronectes platessa TaxID=8262 RepID=A0A9N7UN78_PLEPL|nr:unnamed protein product [Pleuronectes platessa]
MSELGRTVRIVHVEEQSAALQVSSGVSLEDRRAVSVLHAKLMLLTTQSPTNHLGHLGPVTSSREDDSQHLLNSRSHMLRLCRLLIGVNRGRGAALSRHSCPDSGAEQRLKPEQILEGELLCFAVCSRREARPSGVSSTWQSVQECGSSLL